MHFLKPKYDFSWKTWQYAHQIKYFFLYFLKWEMFLEIL